MNLDTYSISEAVLALEKRRLGWQLSALGTTTDDGPVDVVAVVAGVATLNSTLASSVVNARSRVDLRIIDPSIPPNIVAKVSLHGSMEVSRIAEEQISPGDIIRFNRLRLGRHHTPQDSNDGDHHDIMANTTTVDERGVSGAGHNTTLLHFEVALDDPEPGFRWFKLGRIRIMTEGEDDYHGFVLGDQSNAVFPPGRAGNHGGRRAIFIDDRRGATNFPQEMVISDSRIGEILAWYATRGLTARHGRSPGASGESSVLASLDQERIRPSSMAMMSVAGDHNVRSLSPLPCKRRSLAEIQASSGLLSNLVVHITHYDSQVIPLQSATTSFASGASPKPVRHRQVIGFGSVTDSSGVVMSFVDPGDRFGFYLRAGAEDPTKVIMMTNVMSKKQSEIFGRPLVSEEVVLWPTKQTTVSLMDHGSSDERSKEESNDSTTAGGSGGDDRDRRRALPQSLSAFDTAFSDRSTRTRRAEDDTIAVKFGVDEFEPHQLPTQVMTTLDHLIWMESSIDDILVNGLSLRQCLMAWSPVDLQANLLTSDGQEYNSVMIQLAMKSRKTSPISLGDVLSHKQDGNTMMASLHQDESWSSSSMLHVAGSSVVQALCGGIAATEWKVDKLGKQGQRQHGNDELRRTAVVAGKVDLPGKGPTSTTATSDEDSTSLGWNVLRLLHALLHEDVALTWKVDVRHDPPRVDSVILPELT